MLSLTLQVDRVQYNKPGLRVEGTLHLTAHHLIFKYPDPSGDQEIWVSLDILPDLTLLLMDLKVPYPLISTVVRLPLSLYGQSPIAFRTRTFEYFTLVFNKDKDAYDVFESVKELTVTCKSFLVHSTDIN
jgi:myotubularin-related protein 6/7/8